jgi:hypothetical protein
MRLFYLGWPVGQFRRRCLRNPPRQRFGRRCPLNLAPGPRFRYRGHTMSACSPSRILRRASTTSARHCTEAGRSANSIARSPPSLTSRLPDSAEPRSRGPVALLPSGCRNWLCERVWWASQRHTPDSQMFRSCCWNRRQRRGERVRKESEMRRGEDAGPGRLGSLGLAANVAREPKRSRSAAAAGRLGQYPN